MIQKAADGRERGWVLDNGCGVGLYLERLAPAAVRAIGLELDRDRSVEAARRHPAVVRGGGECLPFPEGALDLVLSHEVIEHVADDAAALKEIIRVLRRPSSSAPGGRLVLFAPNRGYPFETHGVFWLGRYRFGNIPFVNYLPAVLRDRLAPHVRAYTVRTLQRLFTDLPVRVVSRTTIYGAYDNLIARWPRFGPWLRSILQRCERTPLRIFGLSHVWVIERT